jgi:hypothetical protein
MLLRYFNSNRVGVLILLVFLPLLYWISSLVTGGTPAVIPGTGTLTGEMFQYLNGQRPVLSGILTLSLVILNAYLLVQLNTIHIFIPAKTRLPALFYILIVTGHNPAFALNGALVASTLIILVLYRLTATYKVDGISYNFLDAGFLTALASLIYFPAAGFLVFLFIALALLRPFNWREYAYTLIGMALPYFFLESVQFLTGWPEGGFFTDPGQLLKGVGPEMRLTAWISAGYMLAMLGYGSYFMLTTIDNMKIQSRKMFILFLWLFLLSALMGKAIPAMGADLVYFAAMAVAFLFSHYFQKNSKYWVNEVLFSLFLLLWMVMRFV